MSSPDLLIRPQPPRDGAAPGAGQLQRGDSGAAGAYGAGQYDGARRGAGLQGSAGAGPGPVGRVAKRAFDIAVSLVLLAAFAPLVAALALVMRWQLRRPALFRQVRVTGDGKLAEILKLRTLPDHGNPDTCWAVPLHAATATGRFLRATHLDELPQLCNVLLGQMSLVGPRPERPYFAERFGREIPGYAGRNRMTAGLTGWAQVHGLIGDSSIRERARFDNAYIENWSFWLDLVILARTASALAATVARAASPARHRARAVPLAAASCGIAAPARHPAGGGSPAPSQEGPQFLHQGGPQ